MKVLLIRTYLEAGLPVGADYAYSLLDCKHIQLDSLGHLHAPLLAPLGFLSQASNCLDHAAKFFIANYKDVSVLPDCFFFIVGIATINSMLFNFRALII